MTLAPRHLDWGGINRLARVLNGNCKCVVLERFYIDKDYRDTFSHFHSKRFSTPDSRCVRLHFFSEPVTDDEIAAGDVIAQNAYLGYSVIRPTKPNCLGRTLLTHHLRLDVKSHLSTCEEPVNLFGAKLTVKGFPFISQDTDATVCAESALWMLLRYYSNRYSTYSEICPFQITNLANNHALGRRVYPSPGLYSWQLAEALRLQRFSPVVYRRDHFPEDFDHLLYTYIESGLPLLATVPGHVVVAHGHASEYTRPLPINPSGLVYTSYFNQFYVIHDDNQFPYEMLLLYGPANQGESRYLSHDIDGFIVPLPEKVFLTAEDAKTAIEAVLKNPTLGLNSSPSLAGKNLIMRLFLTSARSFKRTLHKRGMGNSIVEKLYRNLPMPHFVWICEIAEHGDYTQDQKILGEVIWDATRNAREPDGWIALHLPESISIDLGSATNTPQAFQKFEIKTHNSYSLFDSNLQSL